MFFAPEIKEMTETKEIKEAKETTETDRNRKESYGKLFI